MTQVFPQGYRLINTMEINLSKDGTAAAFEAAKDIPQYYAWLVEDNPDSAAIIRHFLESIRIKTQAFSTGNELLAALKANPDAADVICLDLSLPDISGLELLPIIKQSNSHLPVVVITADTAVESIVEAVRCGAYDYLPKNTDRTKFTTTILRAVEYSRLSCKLAAMNKELKLTPQFGMVGVSPAVKSVLAKIQLLAAVDINVLISGQSGTGKELVARALHSESKRKDAPFVAINCAALSRELLESELFGHERGSFTGAQSRHIGAFERANGGTLFLDEMGELDLSVQAKLLRVIQERKFLRVGATTEISSDFRLVAATNRDLLDEVSLGRFRQDLYYRLAVSEISLPALKQRSGDIALLANHFVQEFNTQLGKEISLSAQACAALEKYSWPGNIRELQNVLQFALIECHEQTLLPHHLPARVVEIADSGRMLHQETNLSTAEREENSIRPFQDQEKEAILEALKASSGKVSKAAKLLNISRATFYRRLKEYEGQP